MPDLHKYHIKKSIYNFEHLFAFVGKLWRAREVRSIKWKEEYAIYSTMYNDNILIIYRIINMEKMCANSIKYQQIRRQQADPHFKLLNYQTPVCRYAPVSVSLPCLCCTSSNSKPCKQFTRRRKSKVNRKREIWGKREFEAHVWTRMINIFVIVYVNR